MAKPWAKSFYNSRLWQDTRRLALQRDRYTCQDCGYRAEEVHHIIELTPDNIHDRTIALNPDNLMSLCTDCHFKRHKTQQHIMDGFIFDANGMIVPKSLKVIIVYGSPASGKTTYVRNNMKRGDLVIDLDMISQAISLCNKTDVPREIVGTSLKVREYLYSLIQSRDIQSNCVWVVAGLPKRQERKELQHRLRAELVYIEATKEECMNRAMNDGERTDKAKQRMIIGQWHAKYER